MVRFSGDLLCVSDFGRCFTEPVACPRLCKVS